MVSVVNTARLQCNAVTNAIHNGHSAPLAESAVSASASPGGIGHPEAGPSACSISATFPGRASVAAVWVVRERERVPWDECRLLTSQQRRSGVQGVEGRVPAQS